MTTRHEEVTRHTFEMTEDKADMIHGLVSSHIQALKNRIASSVEAEDFGRAKRLVGELRQYERLYSAFNVRAKREFARFNDQPISTQHYVQ